MTPTQNMGQGPSPQFNQLQGGNTTITGILAILMGGLGLFSHIFGAVQHGTPLDPTIITTGLSGITGGVGLIKAADSKQSK